MMMRTYGVHLSFSSFMSLPLLLSSLSPFSFPSSPLPLSLTLSSSSCPLLLLRSLACSSHLLPHSFLSLSLLSPFLIFFPPLVSPPTHLPPPPPPQLAEMRAEYQRENEDILDNIRQIAKEVQLQALVMDHFIPLEYQVTISTPCHTLSTAQMRFCRWWLLMCAPPPFPSHLVWPRQTVLHDHAEWQEDTGEWHVVSTVQPNLQCTHSYVLNTSLHNADPRVQFKHRLRDMYIHTLYTYIRTLYANCTFTLNTEPIYITRVCMMCWRLVLWH